MKQLLFILLFVAVSLPAQVSGVTKSKRRDMDPQYQQQRGGQIEPFEERLAREQAKARNKERQESMKKDMEELHRLATELKVAVEKTSENMLSLEVIRKTEEVEKLAKKIREKMKADYMMPGPEVRN